TSTLAAPTGGIVVPYTLGGNATLTSDYTGSAAPTGNITIAAGAKTGTLILSAKADSLTEADAENITVTLGTVMGATVTTGTATTTITDTSKALGTAEIALSATASSVDEGGAVTYTVTRGAAVPTGTTVVIPYTLAGTATSGTDYTRSESTGSLTIAAGATAASVTVTTIADNATEGTTPETVIMTLGTLPTGTTPATGQGGPITTSINDTSLTGVAQTLTLGTDKFTGSTFDAPLLFNAPTGTQILSLQTGDVLTGTAGTFDTLTGVMNAAATPSIANVEIINLSTTATNTLTASAITGSGVTISSDVLGGVTQTIQNLAAGVNLGFSGAGTLTTTLTDATGTADVMNLTLKGTTYTGGAGATYTNAGVEKLNIASSGSSANSVLLSNWSSATTANKSLITGTQNLELLDGTAAGNSFFDASFIDASGLVSAGKTLTLTSTVDRVARTMDTSNFVGVGTIKELIRDTGTTTYTNYQSGLTLEFAASSGTNHIATNLVATNAGLTGSTDVLNLKFTGVGGSGGVGGTTDATGVETLNILGTSTNATPGILTFKGTTTLAAGAVGKLSTIVIDPTSNQNVTFTGVVTADAINAAGLTKVLTVTTTGSQMAITGGSGADSITTGAFASVIDGGAGNDTISSLAATGVLAVNIKGGAGADAITLGLAQETVVFGNSTTWGDTITDFETLVGGSDDILNFSVSNGFAALKHGTSTGTTLTYDEGVGTVGGANDTLFVSTTAAATLTTAALLQANGTYGFTGEAVGDHTVLVVVNSVTAASIYDVVAGNADGLITTADTVTLIGTLSSIDAAAGDATTLTNWAVGNFSFV
ncbi:Calx-beta domain-containing protein, partial [Chromatium okenii]|uniref:beta strand repeat-containing protein n=1 Tax=Chromatium okenii TaxID=61644 RepID=UPI0026F1D2AF